MLGEAKGIYKVAKGIYKIDIPLPNNPLKAINSYLIEGKKRHLMIDTGMNREECRSKLVATINALGVDLRKTDFFITHLHADHLGLVRQLASETSKIYINGLDAQIIKNSSTWDVTLKYAAINGFPAEKIKKIVDTHPYRYGPVGKVNYTILGEDDTIKAGDYLFRCISTPGHTPGSMCLYEPTEKLLFSGDHIICDITPNISIWFDTDNPLMDYLNSLDKIYKLDVKLVLPGHREIFNNCRKRIEELKNHHIMREKEVLKILNKWPEVTAYFIASHMEWDYAESWDRFPEIQKWFATRETLAHLRYLKYKGLIREEQRGNFICYSTR